MCISNPLKHLRSWNYNTSRYNMQKNLCATQLPGGLLSKEVKIFRSYVKHFWILAGVRKFRIFIGLNKIFWVAQAYFSTGKKKPASFFFLLLRLLILLSMMKLIYWWPLKWISQYILCIPIFLAVCNDTSKKSVIKCLKSLISYNWPRRNSLFFI